MLVALLALACACAGVGLPWRASEWASPLYRDHPLVGRVWDARAGAWTTPEAVFDRAAAHRFVLLGEKHDNADHHRLQARAIRDLVARGRRPAVVFEMISVDRADDLAEYLSTHPGDAAGLGTALEWEKNGWPDWSIYRPIAEAALEAGLPLAAGNFSMRRVQAFRTHRFGPKPEVRSDLGLDAPVPERVRKVLTREIEEAHCGKAPAAMLPAMVEIQHARDLQLAKSLREAAEAGGGASDAAGGAVLIAGAAHARRALAVPLFLPDDSAYVLAFVEVQAGETDPSGYARGDQAEETPAFDTLWFTPRVDDLDPCERFRERLEEMGRGQE